MTGPNPYVGARTFKPEEGDLFFGREQEAFDLLSLVISDRLVLFYAQSGAGKSSLINTRLIPGLLSEGEFRIFPVGRLRRDEATAGATKNVYVYNLLSSLSPQQADESILEQLTLSDYLKHLKLTETDGYLYQEKSDENIFTKHGADPYKYVLIIDQFEELFSTHEEKWRSRAEFFTQLAAAMKEFPRLWVVLVMREDYIAYLDPYIDLLPGSLRTRYYMQRLGHRAAIQAVEGPAAKRDRPFAEGVARKLIDDLSGIKVRIPDHSELQTQPGQFVEPVQLQVVCSSLWEKLPSNVRQITEQHLEQYVGDVDQALGNYYEERVKTVAEGDVATRNGVKERDIREWFGSKLITGGGIRNMIARERDGQSGGLDDGVVQEFVKRGDLVRAEIRGGATFYELTHDRMVEPILENNAEWFADHSSLLQTQTALWVQQGRSNGMLLRGRALRNAWKETETLEPTEEEKAFLSASRIAERNRTIVGLATGIAVVAMAMLSFLAVQASNRAQVQRYEAEAQRAFAEAKSTEAFANAMIAATNAQVAATNEQIARDQQALAMENRQIAEAQRSAARAQIYQSRPGGLYISTLLAIDSLRRIPSDEAEEILRKNISLLPLPIAQFSQGGRINAIAVSPVDESNTFVTASADGTACAWQIEAGKMDELFCTPAGEASINAAAFSPDGSWIATGDQSGVIQLFDMRNGTVLHTYERIEPTGTGVQIVDVKNGNVQDELTILKVPVRSISIHPRNGQVAVAYEDGEILIFNPNTGRISSPLFIGDFSQVMSFSPNGSLLAAGTENGQVAIWDLSALTIFSLPIPNRGGILTIAFSPDGREMATGGKDNSVVITNVQTRQTLMVLPTQNWVRDIAYSPDGTWLVTVSDDHRVRVWDSLTGDERFAMAQEGIVTEVTISSDSRWIATTGDDQTVRVWNAATGAETLKIPLEASGSVLTFSPDSRYLVSTDQRGGIQVWDISVMPAPSSFARRSGIVGNVKYSPSQELIAVSEGNIVQVQPATGSRLATATITFQSNVDRLVFSPDSKFLGILTEGNDVRFYTIQTHHMNALTVSSLIQSIAFSPDSQQFLAVDSFGNIQAWDVNTAQEIGNPVQKPLQAFSLATSPQFLALGTENKISIVGADINDEISTIDASAQDALLVFSPDGALLASATPDGRIDIWRYQNGQFTSLTSFVKDQVTSLAFSTDGTMLAVGTAKDVFLMDLASGKERARIPHPDRVNDLSFSPDGTRLVTASARILQFWELDTLPQIPTEDLVGTACSRLFENFSPTQWETIFSGEAYRPLCEHLPVPP